MSEYAGEIERLTECAGPDSMVVSWMRKMFFKKVWLSDSNQRIWKRQKKDRKTAENSGKDTSFAGRYSRNGGGIFAGGIFPQKYPAILITLIRELLLVHGMCYAVQTDYPENAHQWRELLLFGRIVPDNIFYIVYIYGLRLQVDGDWHPAYDAFCRRQEPSAVTTENLRELTAVQPTGDKVYIVENEMVFSYHSGDIDPDGIRIADRLWKNMETGFMCRECQRRIT